MSIPVDDRHLPPEAGPRPLEHVDAVLRGVARRQADVIAGYRASIVVCCA